MPDIRFHCDGCGKDLCIDARGAGMQVDCPRCGGKVIVPDAIIAPPLPNRNTVAHAVNCEKCRTPMQKTKKVDKSILLQIVGVFLFIWGFFSLIIFPIGTFFGILLMIAAARLGYSKKPVWLCPNCGFFFERAN